MIDPHVLTGLPPEARERIAYQRVSDAARQAAEIIGPTTTCTLRFIARRLFSISGVWARLRPEPAPFGRLVTIEARGDVFRVVAESSMGQHFAPRLRPGHSVSAGGRWARCSGSPLRARADGRST